MNKQNITFSFGKNWNEFVKKGISEEQINTATSHLLKFLGTDNLQDKTFLDIGCGSGLHSLCALLSGAKTVTSFDVDENSITATNEIKKLTNQTYNWKITKGSILDEKFVNSLPQYDVVYSWGVLHHTGKMWEAIKNCIPLIKNGGIFYLALYTTDKKSNFWLKIKKRYNNANYFSKKIIEAWYLIRYFFLPHILRLKNPIKHIKNYKKNRGMSFYTDVKDWLGGYPFEHAKIEEVIFFCKKYNLELINLKTGEANTEYLFVKS